MGRPKKSAALPQVSQEAPLNWVSTIYSPEANYDVEKSKKAVMERAEKSKTKKSEAYSIASNKAAVFIREANKRKFANKGLAARAWADTEALDSAVGEFFDFTLSMEIRPYVEGLCIWLGIDKGTYNAILTCGDERSKILKQFELTLGFLSAQAIATVEGNPVGDIYLDKSRLGYTDQHEQTLNINVNPTQNLTTSAVELSQIVSNTPDDYVDVTEYEEVEE